MKKALYIIYIPLLLIEWLADMLLSIVKVVHNSIEILTLTVQREINEPIAEAPEQSETAESKRREQVPGNFINGRKPTANDRRAVSRVRR